MTFEEMEEQFWPLSDAEWEVFNETFDYWNKVAPRRRLPRRRQSWDSAIVVRGNDDDLAARIEAFKRSL